MRSKRILQEELEWSRTLRRIHQRDAIELEEMYRTFVFPDLPRRPGREAVLSDLIGTTTSEAIYILESLHASLKVEGGVCEFGVAQGATSKLLASEIMATDRKLYLFDSFEGLPAPSPEDRLIDDIFNLGTMAKYKGTMKSPESEVLAKLDDISFPRDRLRLLKGWVEDTLAGPDAPRTVAFAYVDFDFYGPIKTALDYLRTAMPVGGRIVVDDYGFFSEGAQKAVDDFVAGAGGDFKMSMPLPFAGKFAVLERVAAA